MEISGPNHEGHPEYTNTLWDEVTVLYLLDPSFVTRSEERYIDIDTTMGMNYGRSIGYKTEPRRPDDFTISRAGPEGGDTLRYGCGALHGPVREVFHHGTVTTQCAVATVPRQFREEQP